MKRAKPRTVRQVEAAQSSVTGCCDRNVDQQWCDCLARAQQHERERKDKKKPPAIVRESVIELPLPPSANHMWRSVGGKVLRSLAYRRWMKSVLMYVAFAMPKYVVPVRVEIEILGGTGFSKQCDLDNRIKPIMDALVKAGRIDSDTHVSVPFISIGYVHQKDVAAFCRVTVRSIEDVELELDAAKV